MTRFAPCAFVVFCFSLGALGSAAADPAPIVYAGQATHVSTASLGDGLAGGGETSYGYGASQRRGGAIIDLRRPSAPAVPVATQAQAPVATPAAPQTEQGTSPPDWLERERVGPPYEANGRWYVPTAEPGYSETGSASWYGPQFHGQRTASGEVFDQEALTAAHPTLPIPSLVQVTNLENGREIIVRVNDRGPFVGERLIDLSHGAATVLGFEQAGQARVHVRYLGPAPRRVASDGTAAPASSRAQPTSLAPQVVAEEGPTSLLPPTPEHADSGLDGAPMEDHPRVPHAPAPGGDSGYFVQVGAYSDPANAQRVRGEVEPAGPAAVDVRQTVIGVLFRVRVGPWGSREEADAAQRTLASLGYGEAIVAPR
jgi:rare lipoprotein A